MPDVRFYITAFLEARRRGYPVAESNVPITVLTLEDYMSALDFLFREALVSGTTDRDKIMPDGQERTSKWKKKEGAEFKAKKLLRQSPGTITGNPMHNDAVKRYKSAAEKDARQHGERSVTSAPVTWSMVQRLYTTFVMFYLPGNGVNTPLVPACESVTGTERPPSSLAKCDFIMISLYALAWITLARPFSLLSMSHEDVSQLDLRLPENQRSFNTYVVCFFHCPAAMIGTTVVFSAPPDHVQSFLMYLSFRVFCLCFFVSLQSVNFSTCCQPILWHE